MNYDHRLERVRAADRLLARIDERERNAKAPCNGCFTLCADCYTDFESAAPTEAERAIDKYWGKYLLEIQKLQPAVDGIAVKPPHDCFENFSAQLVCRVCGARYVEQKGKP